MEFLDEQLEEQQRNASSNAITEQPGGLYTVKWVIIFVTKSKKKKLPTPPPPSKFYLATGQLIRWNFALNFTVPYISGDRPQQAVACPKCSTVHRHLVTNP